MARLTIPDEQTYATFTATAQTVFPISFALLSGKIDLRVSVNDVERAQSEFTFSGALLDGGGYQGGTVTLNSSATGAVVIWRDVTTERESQFAPSNVVPVRSVDMALNRAMALAQDARRDLGRALVTTFGETPPSPADVVPSLLKANKTGNNLEEGDASAFRDVLLLGPLDDVKHQSVSGADFVAAGGLGRFGGTNDPGGFILGRGDPRSGPTDGAKIGPDGHGNWVHVETTRVGNPTELIVYSKALSGRAQGLNGTNVIERLEGDDVTPIAIGEAFYFAGRKLKVSGKPAYGQLAVTNFDGTAITFDGTFSNEFFKWVYTTGDGIANIVGGQLKYVSGTPFPPLFFTDFSLIANGVTYTAAQLVFIDQATYGFSGTPPANASSIAFSWKGNINDQVTTFRLQLEQGINEENLNMFAFAGHPTLGRGFLITSDYAGLGKNRPLYIGLDDWSPGDPKVSIGFYPKLSDNDDAANRLAMPDGGDYTTLGGPQGDDALRVLNAATKGANKNRFEVVGGATGFGPTLRTAGAGVNLTANYDAKGLANHTFSHNNGDLIVDMNGLADPNAYLELTSLPLGFAAITAKPTNGATSADLRLDGSGPTGRVMFGDYTAGVITQTGSIEIKLKSGSTFRVAGQII